MRKLPIVGVVAASLMLSSCASVFTRSSKEITFKGVPGTRVTTASNNVMVAEIGPNGFGTAKVQKSRKGKTFTATLAGYNPQQFYLGTKINGWFWANLLFGGVVGMGIDIATGKLKTYNTDLVDVTLSPLSGSDDALVDYTANTVTLPQTIAPAAETPVTVATPTGVNVNENINWTIDSDPQNARVFVSVISSTPQVLGTNETYVGTTPMNMSRELDIQGLTTSNANSVEIEIKVSKRGYSDQTKRFNVQKVLAQKGINSFFELQQK